MTFSLSLHKIRALLQTQNERRVIFFPSLPLPPSFFELPLNLWLLHNSFGASSASSRFRRPTR
jgi:hypothetical protein